MLLTLAVKNKSKIMETKSTTIVNKLGLHARASAKLTKLANKFRSTIWITKDHRRVNAKSIMGVMMLAAAKGSVLDIEADGPDAESAVTAIVTLIEQKFGEEE